MGVGRSMEQITNSVDYENEAAEQRSKASLLMRGKLRASLHGSEDEVSNRNQDG